MNITDLHTDKAISTNVMFKTETGSTIALQIKEGEQLVEHITKVPALLLCIKGHAIYEDEKGFKKDLNSGDYVNIEAMVKHWVDGVETSQLILIK